MSMYSTHTMAITTDDFLKIEKIVQDTVKEELKPIDEKINHLPTKEFFAKRMDDLTKEIQDARDEFAAHTKQHADIHDQDERNEKR